MSIIAIPARKTAHVFFWCLLCLTTSLLTAQSICDDDRCDAALDDIRLDEPRDPVGGEYDAARLAAFTQAYDRFRTVEQGHRADGAWVSQYELSNLGGRRCLRFYDLESRFAYEYDKSADFRAYVDASGADPATFRRRGFESSRRGMNLQSRLDRDCPDQVRRSEREGTSELEDRRQTYQHLGVVQGSGTRRAKR